MKTEIVIFLFLTTAFGSANNIVKEFNKSIPYSDKKEYQTAIQVIEKVIPESWGNEKKLGAIVHYQLGTLQCLDGKNTECIQELIRAFRLDHLNSRILKNLELAYTKRPQQRNKVGESKEQSKKKAQIKRTAAFNQRFKNQIKQLNYAERRVFRSRFRQKMRIKRRSFTKDW